jgi:DNA-directed RNA polymerase subunit RPC12/RpoP
MNAMPTDKITVSFRCERCGTTLEWPDDAIPSTKIACQNCGADAGTFGDLNDKAMEAARDHVEGMIKKALEGL